MKWYTQSHATDDGSRRMRSLPAYQAVGSAVAVYMDMCLGGDGGNKRGDIVKVLYSQSAGLEMSKR
jgi:hypothetical protein